MRRIDTSMKMKNFDLIILNCLKETFKMREKVSRKYEKEYGFLRDEIMHHKKRQNQFSTFVCTALITVLGGAAITKEHWISLLGFLIIFPCSMKSFESRYSISLLAAYMSTALEPYAGFQWETNLLKYYEKYDRVHHEQIVYRFSKYDYVFYSFGTSIFYWLILYHKTKKYFVEKDLSHDFISILASITDQFHNIIVFIFQLLFIIFIWTFTYIFYDYKSLKQNGILKWNALLQKQFVI